MSEYFCLSVERVEHVFRVGLNRPEKRNAFSVRMLRELAEAYTEFERDPEARVLLLFAHGEHFTGGLDLAEVGPAVAGGAPLIPHDLIDPLDLRPPRRSKPVVCAAQGWCLTIGVELLLASDIRLCASDARLAQMEVRRGIMPFGGATLRLPRLAGWGNGMRWLLTGGNFDAQEALRIGLVQEVVEPARLLTRAGELAGEVAAQAPLAVQACLRSARLAQEAGDRAAVDAFEKEVRALMATEDAAEGLMSFVERRPARFAGR